MRHNSVRYFQNGIVANSAEWCATASRWNYALVRHITRDSLFALSFDRILDIQLTEESFKIEQDFDAQSWFSDCYGVVKNPDADLERVVIRAFGREAYYLRDLPFHHSQKEIASGEDWTDFEYLLRISSDFYTPLLSRGPNIKVLQPQWLAEEIRQRGCMRVRKG